MTFRPHPSLYLVHQRTPPGSRARVTPLGKSTRPMLDHHFSGFHVAAAVLWVLGAAAIISDLFFHVDALRAGGLYCSVGAATLNVRGTLRHMEGRQVERERNAFEIGRDSVRRISG